MDKHPIEDWDLFVHSTLHPAALLQPAPGVLSAYLVTAFALKETLRIQLLRDTFYNKTDTEMELLVERYQIVLTNLLDELFHYRHNASITCEVKQFYLAVSAQLETIMDLLQNSYGRYFHSDLRIPYTYHLRYGHELKRHWKIIAAKLNNAADNTPMAAILDQHLKKLFHPNEETTVTWRQATYLQNLLKELFLYLSTTAPGPEYVSLTELLISSNFNDFAFMREIGIGIRTEAESKGSEEFRLEFLKNMHKRVSQLLEKTDVALHPAQPAAKQTILEWLTHELTWLEKTAMVPEKKGVEEGIKIHTSITVPVLALITRLLKESGIVTNTNQTEVLKFFAAQFTTLHKAEFSYGHLRSKYYEVDERTKKKVCDYLMMMAQLCKKL